MYNLLCLLFIGILFFSVLAISPVNAVEDQQKNYRKKYQEIEDSIKSLRNFEMLDKNFKLYNFQKSVTKLYSKKIEREKQEVDVQLEKIIALLAAKKKYTKKYYEDDIVSAIFSENDICGTNGRLYCVCCLCIPIDFLFQGHCAGFPCGGKKELKAEGINNSELYRHLKEREDIKINISNNECYSVDTMQEEDLNAAMQGMQKVFIKANDGENMYLLADMVFIRSMKALIEAIDENGSLKRPSIFDKKYSEIRRILKNNNTAKATVVTQPTGEIDSSPSLNRGGAGRKRTHRRERIPMQGTSTTFSSRKETTKITCHVDERTRSKGKELKNQDSIEENTNLLSFPSSPKFKRERI